MNQQANSTLDSAKLKLEIVHNGVEKALAAQPEERVTAILQQAIRLFGIINQPHLLSLFRADGTKVEENQSAEQAGLENGTVLYLRPDSVKGGRK